MLTYGVIYAGMSFRSGSHSRPGAGYSGKGIIMRNWWRAIRKQLGAPWAAYTFAICAGVVLFVALSHISLLWTALRAFYHYIAPVVIGIVIAYVLDPLVKFFEIRIFGKLTYPI